MKLQELYKRQTEEQQETIAHLRARADEAESQIKHLQEKLGSERELASLIATSVKAAKPFPEFKTIGRKKSSGEVAAVFLRSDWHIGEVIQPNEVEGFNGYDWATAQQRLFQIQNDELKWAISQRNAYNLNHAIVICIGDYISGDIHYELQATNEFPVPVQTARAGLLLGEYLRRLAPHFETVTVYEVGADNHGRLTKKPQCKQKASNSFSFLVHTIANTYCSGIKNIMPIESAGAKMLVEVANHRFLVEHGDAVRGGFAGIPYYGFNRALGREALRRMRKQGFDFWVIGHWHVPSYIESRVIVNGSLSGTSEYDHIAGRFASPAQVAFLCHPKHGIFNLTAFKSE